MIPFPRLEWPVVSSSGQRLKLRVKPHVFGANEAEFSEIFRRQLYGYSQDSQLYKHSKVAVRSVWSELKVMGLDLSFILETKEKQEAGETIVMGNGSEGATPSAGNVQGLGL